MTADLPADLVDLRAVAEAALVAGQRPRCERLGHWGASELRSCGGELNHWRGTNGHSGTEWFTTCKRCGATT